MHKPPWRRGTGITRAERGCRSSRGFGKDLRVRDGLPWGTAQPERTQRRRAFVCRARRWGKGVSAEAACLRCIPGIHSLLPAPIGRGWGAIKTGGGRWGLCQPLPHAAELCGARYFCVGAHWLHGGPAGLAGATGPSRSCVVQMREGCCAERRAGCRCPLRDFGAGHQSRASPRAWHYSVPRHGSFHLWGCRESQSLSLSLHSHCRCRHLE